MKPNNEEKLLSEFPANSYAEWKAAAEALLKGAPFEKKLLTRTPEGITLQPIYNASDIEGIDAVNSLPGADGNLRGTRAIGYRGEPWEIAQELPFGEPTAFNSALQESLYRGQSALNVTLDIATLNGSDPDEAPTGEVGACGLSLSCLEDIQAAFRDVMPEAVSFHLQGGCSGLALGALFETWLDGQEVLNKDAVKGSLGIDPLGILAASGTLPTSLEQAYTEMAAAAKACLKERPGFRAVGASGLPYHQAGASAVEELACLLATGLAYLRVLQDKGLSIDEAAAQIRFTVSLGGNFFMELAKLRAFRVLWARIVTELGGSNEAAKALVHGRTGLFNKTRLDPYVNMLRTTTEALCGVTGGVDSLCVGAFDECIRTPDSFSARIARNTQVILQEECELTAVADPAGGSWFVEKLTDELGRAAWSAFQDIEKDGGMFESLSNGKLQKCFADTFTQKSKLLAQRRSSLIGTNQYPNATEKPLETRPVDYSAVQSRRARALGNVRLSDTEESDQTVMNALGALTDADPGQWLDICKKAFAAGASLGEVTKALRGKAGEAPTIEQLPSLRLAAPYETLREASRKYAAENGHGPKLFLVNLGALRRHKLRADFTRGFFETGGFEVVYPKGFDESAAAIEALKESGAKAAILCGHDDDYAEKAVDFFKALKDAVPGLHLMLAGDPGDKADAFTQAGMDGFISIKSNNYETNAALLKKLGVL